MMVFDLDPGPPANIVQCCQVGMWLREIFEHFGLQSFPKTSGSKGLQIYVPLNTPTSYDQTKPFAHALARLLESDHRNLVVSDMKKELRVGKVLVDWSQNDEHKTTIGVYSLRARERPTVSTPVKWEEVEQTLKKKDADLLVFDAGQVLKRVEKMGDLFAPVLTLKQKLPKLAGVEEKPGIDIAASRGKPSPRRTADEIIAEGGREAKDAKDIIRSHPWQNSMRARRDGLIQAGSLLSIPPNWRRRNSCSTTQPNLTRLRSTFTFRQLLKETTAQKWIDETPAGFRLSVKAHQVITHIKRLQKTEDFLPRFLSTVEPLARAEKAGAVAVPVAAEPKSGRCAAGRISAWSSAGRAFGLRVSPCFVVLR